MRRYRFADIAVLTTALALLACVSFSVALMLKYGAGFLTQLSVKSVHPSPSQSWQQVVAEKLQRDNDKIPVDWRLDSNVIVRAKSSKRLTGDFIESLLDSHSLAITSLDVPDLVASMENGTLTAVEVVTAFCKRAAFAHQLSKLLLEIGFDIALTRARELDAHFATYKKLVGPLHGIPLTMKDQFHIKGLETSMAYVSWIGTFEGKKGIGKEKHVESELVRELYSLGAVPIGKAPETNNNILGYTLNPHNQNLSSGGSSGGEGAMQALGGSAFGIATDIGGSISMPAAYQGVYSIKPSAGRLSFRDVANTGRGQEVMPTVAGIMAHSVASLRLVFKSLLSTEPWARDPYTQPIPWRSENECQNDNQSDRKPTFGFMPNDGIVVPHPPIARALEIVRQALTNADFEVCEIIVRELLLHADIYLLDWVPPSNNETSEIHGPIARGDGCPDVWEAIQQSGEPIVPEIENVFPGGKRRPPISLPEYEQVVLKMKDYRWKYNDYWQSSAGKTSSGRPVDVVIAPVGPHTAIPPGKFIHSSYTSALNVLDFCNVVIPITFADKNQDIVDPNFQPFTDKDRRNMALYDPELFDGTPAAIQVFGRRLDEERVLSVAQIVVDAVEAWNRKHHQQ
ncbi:Acetamidase [Triangularia setosa]|uniref:Acetamidase n=1 Tax=Triangularia setosa TaxID=2587417 RepID=A0AAN6VZE7_9PEZI|nr:Acetamidase [Podospora setosa]